MSLGTSSVQTVPSGTQAVTPPAGDHWLLTALALAAAGKMTRRQFRKLKWKLTWEMIKQKFTRKKGKKKGKVQWGLVIFFGLILIGTIWLSFAAGIGGALLKTIGVFVAIMMTLWIYGLIVGWWGLK
jgi:hypothetical protein